MTSNESSSEATRPHLVGDATCSQPAAHDARLGTILDQYLEDLQAGRVPDRAEMLARHPDLADQLASCLDGIEFVHRSAASPEPVPQQVGDFRIIREIGRGGMGVVYEAEQISLKRRVALKILRHPVADKEAMQRFQREAETVACLHHTNIVPIHAVGSEEHVHYYAMQFIEGESLGSVLHRAKQAIDAQTVATWGLQAAEALAHAHGHGVIHRDVKPSNLIRDREGRIWLTDFGLAKRLDDVRLSMTGALLGTPRYMSPEQASAVRMPIDHRTDVYSLGATLYELVTGRPLFPAEAPHAVIGQILSDDPVPPRVVRASVPRDLDTIIMKCLRKDAAGRYTTAQELANDLRAFLEDRPISARRPSAVETAARWLQKHQRVVTTAGVAAALATVLIVGSLWAVTAYRNSLLGHVRFGTDQPPLVAEVLDEDGKPAIPAFTLPTQQPVALPEGDYEMRVSSPRELGDRYRLSVLRGQEREFEVNLENRRVWSDLDIPGAYELVEREGRTDVVIFGEEGIKLVHGGTRQELWFVELASKQGSALASSLEPGFHWRWQMPPETSPTGRWRVARHPLVVTPASDLDGDGLTDIVLACRHQATMLALSGEDGTVLWANSGVPAGAEKFTASRQVFGSVIGTPAVHDVDGDGVVDFVAAMAVTDSSRNQATLGARWIEAISGRDGGTISRYELADAWFGMSKPTWFISARWRFRGTSPLEPPTMTAANRYCYRERAWGQKSYDELSVSYAPLVFSIDGKPTAIVVAGDHLAQIELLTGTSNGEPRPLGFAPVCPPRLVDLDGQGLPELLLCNQVVDADARKTGGRFEVVAWDLKQNQPLWNYHAEADWQWNLSNFRPPASWPLIEDLDRDGAVEIILPDGNSLAGAPWNRSPRGRLQVLDGRTGKALWQTAAEIRTAEQQVERFVVGPDIDADGTRDIFVASISGVNLATTLTLFVDALSGTDGRKLWWAQRELEKANLPRAPHVAEVFWWNDGGRSLPLLAVATLHDPDQSKPGSVYFFDVARGELARVVQRAEMPRLADADGDGRTDLFCFHPTSHIHHDQGGQLSVWRGVDPQAWKRIGQAMHVVGDINQDGVDDLATEPRGDGSQVAMLSGRSGLSLWTASDGYDGTARVIPLAHDVDSDGAPDLLVTQSFSHWPKPPFGAYSGRTGQRLWQTQLKSEVREWHAPQLLGVRDLDGDGHVEIMLAAKTPYGQPATTRMRASDAPIWLFCVSSRTGQETWNQKLCVEGFQDHSFHYKSSVEFADLNQDGTLDLVTCYFPDRDNLALVALDGGSGQELWTRRVAEVDGSPITQRTPLPVIANLDEDPAPEVAYVRIAPLPRKDKVRLIELFVLDGDTGKTKWKWAADLPRAMQRAAGQGHQGRWGRTHALVLDRKSHQPRIGLWLVDASEGHVEFVTLGQRGNSEIGDVEQRLVLRAADEDAVSFSKWLDTFRLWPADINGDGRDELIYHDGEDLVARDLRSDQVEWKWKSPGRTTVLLDVKSIASGREIRLASGHSHGGMTVFGIDTATGKARWRCESPRPYPSSAYPDWIRILESEPLPSALFSLPDQVTTCVRGVTQDTVADDVVVSPLAVNLQARSLDPRRARRLPWAPYESGNVVKELTQPLVLSACLILLPAIYLDHLLRRRRWTLRMLLLAPLLVAVSIVVVQMPRSFDVVSIFGVSRALSRYYLALMGLPTLYFLWRVIVAIVGKRWRLVREFSIATCVISMIGAVLLLADDGAFQQTGDRYVFSGWWMVFFIGAYLVGAALLVFRIIRAVVLRLYRRFGMVGVTPG